MATATLNTAFTSTFPGTGVVKFVANCMAVRAQRVALKNLDDHQLADIGLNYKAASQEAKRASWNVPAGWHA